MSDSEFTSNVASYLRRARGAKISEIAADLEVPRGRVRDAVREIDTEYELGSDSEFRYRILEDARTMGDV